MTTSALASEEEMPARNSFFDLEPVIVNLAAPDTNRYLQVTFTYELSGDTTLENMKTYLPIIRSRALMVLSTKTAEEISSPQGKNLLLDQLLDAARYTLTGVDFNPGKGVENVHLTSFIIQ
ncbi:MAG: flagellar basal body-associated FliL family protein [Limnobacter sp.]|nr:flagellar basal body-associated FliL family protein [Limnobacter sp.]